MKQTDGYIEDKKNQIKNERKVFKYTFILTIPIIILILVFAFGILTYQSPDKWQKTEIAYSCIDRSAARMYSVYSEDGRDYKLRGIDIGELESKLTVGETYSLTYGLHGIGIPFVEALSDGSRDYIKLDESIERRISIIKSYKTAIVVLCFVEIVALFLIDRIAMRKTHKKIKELKAKIAEREKRLNGKNN